MNLLAHLAALVILFSCMGASLCGSNAFAAATLLPPGENCFQANTGITGMVGLLGSITAGSSGTAGTYANVALTGGSGSGATANITVSGGGVTAVTILNPGVKYVVGDVLSAASASIGNTTGFSVPVSTTAINSSLAGGLVFFYIPGTNNFKTTWFNADAASNHQNTNPVILDANGCAIIYGAGSYRQVLQDSLGNTVWDQLTADTSANNNTFWAGQAGGTPNAITVTDAGFNGTDGSVINFIALSNNTGPATLNPSGYFVSAPQITQPTTSGQASLTANLIGAGDIVSVIYSATFNTFQIVSITPTNTSTITAVPTPQGYLTLSNDTNNVIITSDTTGATTVYYTPFTGNQIPIYNGVSFVVTSFSQLTLTLTSSQTANTIYDGCVFLNNGTPTLVLGPAWSNSAVGAGSRGTGANSAQISRVNGIWVNTVQIAATNGANSYTVPANQCTYVGSLYIDATAGQVSNFLSYGQSRKWGVWNAYNQRPIQLQVGDPSASWGYAAGVTRFSHGNSANNLTTFTGLAEQPVNISLTQQTKITFTTGASTYAGNITTGIGLNQSTTCASSSSCSLSGQINSQIASNGSANLTQSFNATGQATFALPPGIGVNTIAAMEDGSINGGASNTFFGTSSAQVLQATWGG